MTSNRATEERTAPNVYVRRGFNDCDPTPKAMRSMPGLRRTALVLSPFRTGAKPVNLDWENCAPLYWRLIGDISELLPEASLAIVNGNRRFNTPEAWLAAERLGFTDPDDGPDAPPRCVWTGAAGAPLVDARTEFWCYAGGPPPYSDSWTISFYSATPELDAAVHAAIVRRCAEAGTPILDDRMEHSAPVPPRRRPRPHPYGLYFLSAAFAMLAVFLLFFPDRIAKLFFVLLTGFSLWMLRIALRLERELAEHNDFYGENATAPAEPGEARFRARLFDAVLGLNAGRISWYDYDRDFVQAGEIPCPLFDLVYDIWALYDPEYPENRRNTPPEAIYRILLFLRSNERRPDKRKERGPWDPFPGVAAYASAETAFGAEVFARFVADGTPGCTSEALRAAIDDSLRNRPPLAASSPCHPRISRKTRIACWALFLVCLFLPVFALGAVFRAIHGLDMFDTGDIMQAQGGPWPFFVMRDLTFVLLPAFAILLSFAVRRLRPWKALVCTLVLGLLGCGLRQCYIPEFDFVWLAIDGTVWIRTDHPSEFSRNKFLRLPLGLTRAEVRAQIGDGYSCVFGLGPGTEWREIAEWEEDFKKGLAPGLISPDAATCWQMTRWGNSESYWRCQVMFDEKGLLVKKSIEWWWD